MVPAPSQDQRGGHRPARLVRHHHRCGLGSAQEADRVDAAGVADDRHTDSVSDSDAVGSPDVVVDPDVLGSTDVIRGTGVGDASLDDGRSGASGDSGFGGAGRAQHT
ncbi:hypothetical protein FRAAL0901 [Frankia alni ACN14a]|uniref:Uncharacterized protein n=1 Tax=Frankia alni (strain DSM 45986 / CECT 9034 / ACN14a) TaxID=326424 RepID=Q0RS97_FRAAA|nr:hypothetical protein FRAAL0901 [Frankia alni ACN14a]